MLELLKGPVIAVQDFFLLTGRAIRNVFRSPHYGDDVALQMDTIGVGSLPIVVMTGFFSGAVMAVARALTALAGEYGAALPRAAGDANELPDLVQGSRRVRRFRGRVQ